MAFIFFVTFLLELCASSSKAKIILCAGDSLTFAYSPFLDKVLRREGIRARILNYGQPGYTSGEYLTFLGKNKDKMAGEKPDFILLQLGTNDVRIDYDSTSREQFSLNVKKIIEIFRKFKNNSGEKTCLLLATIPPIPETISYPFSPKSSLRVNEEINPAIKEIAKEEGIPLVDNYTLFLNSPSLLPEVHPSREGYWRLAWNWYFALKPYLKN